MKLSDHVDKIRNLITASFDKQFARLGIGANKQLEPEKLPEQVRGKRQHLEVMLENHIGETGCYQDAREKLLDELSFTLFNRLAAIKVMESANLFPPVIAKQAEHGSRSFGHKAWLEEYPEKRESELEGIRDYFKFAFNELGDSLPLFSNEYPYALLPDAISLNEIIEAFNAVEVDSQIEDDIWHSDDVLGWLYESYNKAKKQAFKNSKDKTEYDKVSLQSQVYTPRWVVQFLVENSLGKLYLEMYPESGITNQFKITNAPKLQKRNPKPLHEIKLIDPAAGSGNFLLYAFDFFYALYIDQIENYDADYDEDNIPQLIIENNLHGIDLDDRAIQLAQLGLYIKARKKCKFVKGSFNFKVVSSDFYLPVYDEARHIFENSDTLDNTQKELIEDIWNDLRYAYKFGSLIRLDEKLKAKLKVLKSKHRDNILDLFADEDIKEQKNFTEKFFSQLKAAIELFVSNDGDTFIADKTRDAITLLELLLFKYDVASANPPYTDSSDFGPELRKFIDSNYKKPHKFHTNLYATFLKRCCELTLEDGKIAMIHPNTFMFIKSFEGVRSYILNNLHIDLVVDYGLDRVNLFGGDILLDSNCFYVFSKQALNEESIFFNIRLNQQEKLKKNSLLKALGDILKDVENHRVSFLNQLKFKIIKSTPFIYWISEEFRRKFELATVDSLLAVKRGCETNNNNRFLRYWWEISLDKVKGFSKTDGYYYPYAKGGPYNKWYGNIWLTIDLKKESRSFINEHGNLTSKDYYGSEGITYSASGQKGPSFRLLPDNAVFDVGGSSIFPKNYMNVPVYLAYMNSKLSSYIVGCLNPTVNTQIYDIKRLPFVTPSRDIEVILGELAIRCVEIKKHISSFSLREIEFENSPFCFPAPGNLTKNYRDYLNYENHHITQILINEAIINEKIFETYELTEHDKKMVLIEEGESVGALPVLQEAKEAYLNEAGVTDVFKLDSIQEYINALPIKESDEEEFHSIIEKFSSLYKKNKDLEDFCIKNELNPINVWYWFKQSNVLPKARMRTLGIEFLAEIVREILEADDDGVVPLVSNSSRKILFERVEEKFIEKGFSMSEYSHFDNVLGRSLREFLNCNFFAELSDHLNMFMYLPKTPFIWHLTSGSEQGFDCYISIYKWNRDNLMRIRSVYIEHRERALVNRQSDLSNKESVDAQNEKDKIFNQLKEIEVFKVKIDELLEEGYDPILDDGVGKNIAPLQKKKMLAYDVLNAAQLEKYLNADW